MSWVMGSVNLGFLLIGLKKDFEQVSPKRESSTSCLKVCFSCSVFMRVRKFSRCFCRRSAVSRIWRARASELGISAACETSS